MTLVAVVACKDSFYLMADTRTQDDDKKVITDHTKKIFYSVKHKLGVCIADSMSLPDPYDPKAPDKAFSVSYVIDQVFAEIEKRDEDFIKSRITSIDKFFLIIQNIIKGKFGERYLMVFQNHVSLFLACVINSLTIIGSYHGKEKNKNWEEFNYSMDFKNKLCVFSNYQSLIDIYSKACINYPNCPVTGNSSIEKQNKLMSEPIEQYRQTFFKDVFFATRTHVLEKHPASIGIYFEYIKIGHSINEFKALKFKVEDSFSRKYSVVNSDNGDYFPTYIMVKTEQDYMDKVNSGIIKEYCYDGWPAYFELNDDVANEKYGNRKFGPGYGY